MSFVFSANDCAAEQGLQDSDESTQVQFNRDVRPILNQHCVSCHGGVQQAADLSFVYEDQTMLVIEPGNAADSYLFERITTEFEEERMPPPEHGPALSDQEIKVIETWIDQGAKWGGHWAFEAPTLQSLPNVQNPQWPKKRLDHFVLARLENVELLPAAPATPLRWLRRASLDLTGLPPTIEEQNAFLKAVEDVGEQAFEKEVDRLLSSPRFGERWASVWLDTVRYADSKGLGIDGRRSIWKYRDWVIDALNSDMPFDEFTIKQIAGDLLPDATLEDYIATACHRSTQTNEEGGTDDEEFRIEALIDRTNTTWQTWQGLTFGCVQCHSHPYEPIKHEEYYQFLAFFNNTLDCDLSSDLPRKNIPLDVKDYDKAWQLDQQIETLARQDWQTGFQLLDDLLTWTPLNNIEVTSNNQTKFVVEEDAPNRETIPAADEFRTEGTVSRNTTAIVEASLPGEIDQLQAIRFDGLPLNPEQAIRDSEWGFVVSSFKAELIRTSADGENETIPIVFKEVLSDEPFPHMNPRESLNEKSAQGFGAYSRINYPHKAAFILEQPLAIQQGDRLKVMLNHRIVETGSFPLVARRGRLSVSGSSVWRDRFDSEARATRLQELTQLRSERAKIRSVSLPVMQERQPSFRRTTYVFDRGNFLNKTEVAPSSTPGFLPPVTNSENPSRLDMATWLTSVKNPLTARVAVNRFWGQMFDQGIVETQEDFGTSGTMPTHPQLLDDLSVRFQTEMNWSIKSLLREIALSSSYRQSAHVSPKALEIDPRNQLMSRGSRKRLPAETVRDQALAVSGLLTNQLGGPPVHPPIPDGVWKPFQGGDRWATPTIEDPNRYRRSVYTYTKRSIPFPLFASFDAPSREFCTPRRLPSNTPLQALMTMNDQSFEEASLALAKRMLEVNSEPNQQIALGFQRVVCRPPTETELGALRQLYEFTLDEIRGQDSSPQEDSEPAQESADKQLAMSNVAAVLLNMDEVLCK